MKQQNTLFHIGSATLAALLLGSLSSPTAIQAGSVIRLYYEGISSSSSSSAVRNGVDTLRTNAIFPNAPTYREQLDDFRTSPSGQALYGLQGKDNTGTDLGTWVRGYIEAPSSGSYRFYISSDDTSELWLSTNHLAAGLTRLAYESLYGDPLFSGTRLAERQSPVISLAKGQKYYFEVYHKQGGGAAYLQVGWQRPDGVREIIPALHLAQHPLDPFVGRTEAKAAPFFNEEGLNGGDLPAVTSVNEGEAVLLQLDVVAAQPTTITWYSNGVVIPGENLSFLRVPAVSAAADGATLRATVANAFGTLSSTATTLSVTPDTTPPGLASVDPRGNPNGLRVTFSEPVGLPSATNLANYTLQGPGGASLAVQSASLLPDRQSVQLGGAFNFQLGGTYQLTVSGVQDAAHTPNALAPNPSVANFVFAGDRVGPVGFATNSPLGNVTVVENRTARLEVISTGAEPYSYQWYFGGAALVAATERVLEFAATSGLAGDYWAVVSNEFGAATSVTARVTVLADTGAPHLVSARGFAGGVNQVHLVFDELLDQASATNTSTYNLGTVSVRSAALSADGRTVTLQTSLLERDQLYLFTINGLKDRASSPNTLVQNGAFVAEVNYLGEVLLDNPVRYWRFEETNGSATVASLATGADALDTGIGTLANGATLGVAGLVTNLGGDTAIELVASNSQNVAVPNGSDLNITSGPWAKKSFEVWFRANSVPAPGTTGLAATAGLWEQGASTRGAQLYLWRDPIDSDSDSAQLVFHAFNNASDGAGAPWGATANLTVPAIYVQTPVRVGKTYHVVGVLDGDASGTNGFLVLYLNGTEVSRVGGVGQLYIHSSDVQIGRGNGLIHTGQNGNLGYFDGVVDEVAAYNSALPASRVAAHYSLGNTSPPSGANTLAVNRVETHGNPNQVLVRFNQAVGNGATNLSNYTLQTADGAALAIQSATLLGGDQIVQLLGTFTFQVNSNYVLTVANVADRATPANPLAVNPTKVAFSYSVPAGTTYSFNNGVPSGVQIFGSAGVTTSGGYDGSGYLRLTDAVGNQAGAVLFTERHNIETFRLRFKVRLSDTSATPADGFSVNVAADLPTATFSTAEEGFLPAASPNADRLIIAFDNYRGNSGDDSPSIAVKWQGVVLTNVLTGTNGVPALSSADGHWADVDINLQQGGLLSLSYDSVRVLSQLPTGFTLLTNAQVGIGARTGGSYETHWFDDINLNFTDGRIGPVTIAAAGQPKGVVALENQAVPLAVWPTGAGPLTYQWYYNQTPLAGATARTYSLVARTNNAGGYWVVVRNEFSSVTSAVAQVSVQTDVAPPAVQKVQAFGGGINLVRLFFDEPVDAISATDLAHYGIVGLSLLGASLSTDGHQVTLVTDPQTYGQTYTLSIAGVKDRAAIPNSLNTQVVFQTALSYSEEALADNPVRHFHFNETVGVTAASETSVLDTLATAQGAYVNNPGLGQAALATNLPGTAVRLNAAVSNRITFPNGKDLNATVGPWAKRTVEFWFKAITLPKGGAVPQAPPLFMEGGANRGLGIYLYGTDSTSSTPDRALLVWHVFNNVPGDGAGSPWGATNGHPELAVYVAAPVVTNQVYHVVAVLDGDTNSTGQLLLYTNGVLAGTASGAGQIYNHTGTTPRVGNGNGFIRHDAVALNAADYFDGLIDELAIYNQALAPSRVAAHYAAAQAAPLSAPVAPPAFTSRRVVNQTLVLTWEGSARLLRASNITGPFSEIIGATSPYSESVTSAPQAFFRLIR